MVVMAKEFDVKKVIVVLVFLIVGFGLFAQSNDSIMQFNGHDWDHMNDDLRLGLVFGYVLAMANVSDLADYVSYNRDVDEDTLVYFQRIASFQKSVGQIFDDVDAWYDENDRDESLWVVIQIVAGADPAYVLSGEREPMFDWQNN